MIAFSRNSLYTFFSRNPTYGTPPCLRISKRKYLPMPSEFHNRKPPSPSEIRKAVRGIGMDIFWNRPMSGQRLSRYVEIFWNKKGFLLLTYKTNRFHVAVRLFSNRLQMSKHGKNISVTLGYSSCATFSVFLPHFDVICDLLLNKRTATWTLFVKQKHKWMFGRTRNAMSIC